MLTTVDEVVKYFGSVGALAKALGVSHPTAARWVKIKRMPFGRALQVATYTPCNICKLSEGEGREA